MPADDDPPTFDDATAEARYYRLAYKDAQDELEDLKLALQDFQASSKELEDEMEKDLAGTEKREQELRNEAERLRSDLDGWKSRHQATLKDHSTTLAHMHKELESLRASEKGVRAKLRDMELDNDDLEKSERAISSTLSDMENRYNKAVERTALLEQELVDKARLEEELQRVKDELRDTTEELAVLRDQHDDALAKAALTNGITSRQSSSQALPVTPSRHENGDTANERHRNGIPSPDIDSADEGHHLSQQASIAAAQRPSLGQSSASSDRVSFLRASPSKLPVSTFSSPDDTSSSPIPFPSHQQQRTSSPTSGSSAAISRSLNARNLSSLASRKSLTPKTLRDKRTDSVVGEMQDMTSRMQKLTAHLNSRRESMMAGSAIPRARPSLLPVTPASNNSGSTGLPRSSSTKSSISRSGSVIRGMNGSPSMQFSANTATTSERDEFKQPVSTRPPSRLANSSRASVVSQRPQSRLSVNSSRPVTPSARSPTPSSANYSNIGLGNLPGAVSSRSASRRISIGPGGVRKAANPPVSTMPGGSAVRPRSIDATSSLGASITKSASKPAPVWR